MCLSCGCRKPTNDHHDQRNITLEDLIQAGDAAGISAAQALANILDTLKTIAESKHETDGETS